MTEATLLAYAAALLLAVATPGPAMLAVVTTGVTGGARPAAALGLGVAVGDVLLTGLALLGLVALAAAFGWVFAVLKYAGAAYLIWLGIKMWRAAPAAIDVGAAKSEHSLRAFALGCALALSNPKAILFHASLMPLLLDMRTLTASQGILVLCVVFGVNLIVMSVYAVLSGRSSRWFRTPGRQRLMNRIGGGAMVGLGGVLAAR